MKYDAIVIGSGCGGLSCAASLALENKRVLVLEQADAPGGFTRTIAKDSWRWIPGMQYAGSILPDAGDFALMSLLTGGKLKFRRLHTEFQKIKSPVGDFSIHADFELFKADLMRQFPAEEHGIDKYFKQIANISKHFVGTIMPKRHCRFIAEIATLFASLPFALIARKTLQNRLDHYFDDPKLKFILSSFWSSYGLPPKTSPFLIAGGVQSVFMKGLYVPEVADMASGFVETIEKAGGRILLGKQRGAVTALCFEGKAVTGAQTADGTKHEAHAVVSDMGFLRTAKAFIPHRHWRHSLKHLERKTEMSCSAILLRLGFNNSLREITDGNTTYRHFSDQPFTLGGDPASPDWTPANGVLAFSMPPTQTGLAPTAEVMALTDFAHFADWNTMPAARREALEQKITKRMLERFVYPWFPDIDKHLEHVALDNPVTLTQRNDYTGGSAYGIAPTINKMNDMAALPMSQIKNLYFTGADLITLGTTTVMMAGILAASTVLDKNLLKQFMARCGIE